MVQRRRRLLDVEAILDAALALADERGRITMGELAERLGVSASSVYHHVSGRPEIIERLRDRLGAEIRLPPMDGTDWGEDDGKPKCTASNLGDAWFIFVRE